MVQFVVSDFSCNCSDFKTITQESECEIERSCMLQIGPCDQALQATLNIISVWNILAKAINDLLTPLF